MCPHVSLIAVRRNWQDSETGPGEEKVNQLFKTNCNKWHSELHATHTRILAVLHSGKGPFFLLMPVPGPWRPSTVFVQIILPSKWTGVSLKVSRRNWQDSETGPGEEKVNQLFKTNCNKWQTHPIPARLSVSLASSTRLTMTIRSRHTPTTLNFRCSHSLANHACSSTVSRYRGKGRNGRGGLESGTYLYEIALWLHAGNLLRHTFRNH
jgi:hypothetical protein